MGTRTEGPAKGQKLALGLLLAALVAGCVLLVAGPAHAVSTFTVNLTGDQADMNLADDACDTLALLGRQCTLRAAIQQANATANAGGPDLIDFGFFGDGPYTISPASQLPIITQPLIIDGYTQTGATENTLDQPGRSNASLQIELDGTNAGLSATGLVFGIGVSDCVVRGLAINDFGEDGIVFIGSTGHRVEGNSIGTDASGTSAQGNDTAGVHLSVTDGSTIGGADPEDRNIISGNDFFGVWLEGGPSNNRIQNNLIGTNTNGGPLGNGDTGVRLSSSGSGNRILSNSIFANGALGVDLGPGGVTPNDLDDPDTGPNNLQNFPVLTSATTSASTTTIQGNLNSTPNRTFALQFFSNPSGDEGKTFRFQRNITTNANGNESFTFAVPEAVAAGQTVTATATDAQGNTSEFSAPETVVDGTPPAVSRVVPANDATGVSPTVNVLAVFSEPMRPARLNTTTFSLRKVGATASEEARVTYDSAARRATLNPNANLQPGTGYIATVTPGARDEAGNQLDQDPGKPGNQAKIWRFSVRP